MVQEKSTRNKYSENQSFIFHIQIPEHNLQTFKKINHGPNAIRLC